MTKEQLFFKFMILYKLFGYILFQHTSIFVSLVLLIKKIV